MSIDVLHGLFKLLTYLVDTFKGLKRMGADNTYHKIKQIIK